MVPIARLYMNYAAVLVYKFVYQLRHFPLPVFSRFICPSIAQRRVTRTASQHRNTIKPLQSWNFAHSGQRLLDTCTRLPIYRLLQLWNLIDDSIVLYGLRRFRTAVFGSDTLFDDFCATFKYGNVLIYSVFRDM